MAFVVGTPSRSSYGSYNRTIGSIGMSPVASPHMFNQYLHSMEENASRCSSPSVKKLTPDRDTVLDPSFVKRKSKMDQLLQATEQAQNLRLMLCAGSNIVVINAGYKGKRFIYEKMRDLGVQTIIIDNSGSWYALSNTTSNR